MNTMKCEIFNIITEYFEFEDVRQSLQGGAPALFAHPKQLEEYPLNHLLS